MITRKADCSDGLSVVAVRIKNWPEVGARAAHPGEWQIEGQLAELTGPNTFGFDVGFAAEREEQCTSRSHGVGGSGGQTGLVDMVLSLR